MNKTFEEIFPKNPKLIAAIKATGCNSPDLLCMYKLPPTDFWIKIREIVWNHTWNSNPILPRMPKSLREPQYKHTK